MAVLIVEHGGNQRAGVIGGRVVVGRREQDQIRLRDKSIARIHAWIDTDPDGSFFIFDAGSKTGTLVNGQRVAGRGPLHFHDRVCIGPVCLRLEEGEALPESALPIDLRVRPAAPASKQTGISFDCVCGAPMWTPWSLAGRTGRCRACGQTVRVPTPKGFVPTDKAGRGNIKVAHCGVCHGEIQPLEETTRCPACGARFHVECWKENGGCSAYGCSQVGAVPVESEHAASADVQDASNLISEALTDGNPANAFPWASLLLAASVLGALTGTLTFGGTSLFVLSATLLYLFRKKPRRQRRTVFLSVGVSVAGALAGAVISYLWWIGMPWHQMR